MPKSKDKMIVMQMDPGVVSELEYLVGLLDDDSSGLKLESVEDVISYVMECVATGSRRPGSWERNMLYSLGLVSDRDEHHVYRATYGPPDEAG